MGKLEMLAKIDEMVVKMLEHLYFQSDEHRAGDCFMAAIKFIGGVHSFSDRPRAVRILKSYHRLALGRSQNPLAKVAAAGMMKVAMVTKDENFAVMLVARYLASLKPSELCNLTVGEVIRPLQGSGASRRSSWLPWKG